MRYYTPKGECETCARRGKDCKEKMFFLCASSGYNDGIRWLSKPVFDWYRPREDKEE